MNALIYDTETTGLVNFKLPIDHPSQPRLVQIAAVLVDTETWFPQGVMSFLVQPDGFEIPPEVEKIHHISTKRAAKLGVKCSYALHVFATMQRLADTLYAYNADYDMRIIESELKRLNRVEDVPILRSTVDVMKPLTNICKVKGPYGFKWPKLEEAYAFYYGEMPPTAHDALADVHTTMKVIQRWLKVK